jgi:acetoacetyl-CoA synthetase
MRLRLGKFKPPSPVSLSIEYLMSDSSSSILWKPSDKKISAAQITAFAALFLPPVAEKQSPAEVYNSLHQASVDRAGEFWRAVAKFSGIQGQLGHVDYVRGQRLLDGRWFPEGSINFASELMQVHKLNNAQFANSLAIVSCDESAKSATWSRQQLFDEVRLVARYFYRKGIRSGDRIAAIMPNVGETVVAMLAATSLGAIWSSCSPEFGDDAICDRFCQIEPKILITASEVQYNQKKLKPIEKVLGILSRLNTVRQILVVGDPPMMCENENVSVVSWSNVISAANRDDEDPPGFTEEFLKPQPFNHPLYIVYSSGTTGVPKCIVHGVGGSLLQHLKEHQLHCDLKSSDTLLYYTTTGWMMWNWLVSGLASGATIITVDGSPFAGSAGRLFDIVNQHRVTHFGAGAKFYASVQKEGFIPKDHFDLTCLKCVMSTGSPLLDDSFDWIYDSMGGDFNLASISGGTDLLSCFVLGNPTLPVVRGEIQCAGLGMDVRVVDPNGNSIDNEPGELVCRNAFPSMPIDFWNDPDGQKYHHAYFDRFPNVWCHGDWACRTSSGGFIIFGRSDATLNPGGVRIGTAEIYQQLEPFEEILECLATVVRTQGDEEIVLFVKLAKGHEFDATLVSKIRRRIRLRCSPRHVPTYISAAPDLPRTISGKLSEIAVRNAIAGTSLGNAGALANPQCLQYFESWTPESAL